MALSASYRMILHRMGYYNYQRGLIYRHLNQEGGWNTHLRNCRNFILKSIDSLRPAVVTVLGSGWLLDLPLKELAEKVHLINLVDIVHPPEVKSQACEIENVVLIEEDVTGGLISEVWDRAGRRTILNKLRTLDGIKIPEYTPAFDPGMIISLNLITQLETQPVALLRKKASVPEESFLNFRKEIQQKHISFLKKHKFVLITDLSEVVTANSGSVNEILSVLIDLPEGGLKEEWTWNFDLRNSDYYRKKSVLRVAAILFDNESGENQKNIL
ncbi:MAG: hypothetical protein WAL29_08730 [Bacteroidales bacterium]